MPTFARLRRAYLLALGLIALAVLAEQLLVGDFLRAQEDDAEIINVAGRQRMLSQRLVKLTALGTAPTAPLRRELTERHGWLKSRPAAAPQRAALAGLDTVLAALTDPDQPLAELDRHSETFLRRMDAIVGELSQLAAAKVTRLQRTKRWLGFGTLTILLLELLFLFRPLDNYVRRQIAELRAGQADQAAARERAERAVAARDASLHELSALNYALDQAVLFATLRRDGSPIHLSRQFTQLLGLAGQPGRRPLAELLHPDENVREGYAAAINDARAGRWTGEWTVADRGGARHQLLVTLIPARRPGSQAEIFLLATDVTAQRADQADLRRINRERLEEEVERGRTRSRQITEAQERERLRIARNLHDGIGQQLTGLKFSLEALRAPPEDDAGRQRIEQLRALTRDIILSVRTATFNLSPPELTDYGLVAALEKMCGELSRLTGQRILLENDGFDRRLDPAREINLYRVVQEAVNNAIKYAGANYVLVRLSAGRELFSITVTDDGAGFETGPDAERPPADGTGLGLASIRSRVEDIGGRLFLRSDPETGTKLTINVPLS